MRRLIGWLRGDDLCPPCGVRPDTQRDQYVCVRCGARYNDQLLARNPEAREFRNMRLVARR
jgi:transcription initiation factor TFIIIB Brf1 subunit/transcription initiation factor TFIIB